MVVIGPVVVAVLATVTAPVIVIVIVIVAVIGGSPRASRAKYRAPKLILMSRHYFGNE